MVYTAQISFTIITEDIISFKKPKKQIETKRKAYTNRVHIAPIAFRLGMHKRIPIYLRC